MSSCYFICFSVFVSNLLTFCFPCCLLGGGNKEFKIVKSFEFLIYLVHMTHIHHYFHFYLMSSHWFLEVATFQKSGYFVEGIL